jgi:hypothetical protein
MASKQIIDDVIASRISKLRNMGVDSSRHEPAPRKASRLADGVPYYGQPLEKPEDLSEPQALGDKRNLRAKNYADDLKDNAAELSRWADARQGDSTVGNVAGERKPNSSDRNLGSGFVGSEHRASKPFGKPSREMPRSPANEGPGARRAGGDPQGAPIRSKRILGRGR